MTQTQRRSPKWLTRSTAAMNAARLQILCFGSVAIGCTGNIIDNDLRDPEVIPADGLSTTARIGPETKDPVAGFPIVSADEKEFLLSEKAYLSPRLRMKSNNEIFRAIKATFGFEVRDLTLLPEETIDPVTGFSNISSQLQVGEAYYLALQKLARIVKDGATTESLLRFCTGPNAAEAACAGAFVMNHGKILFGRDVDPGDKESLMKVYTESRTINPDKIALRDVLETMVQMPSFIYRTELGIPAAARGPNKLTPQEIAAALSSYFWEGPPDAALLSAANSDLLSTSSQIATQTNRLFNDPKAKPAFAKFVDLWLEIGRLGALHKDNNLFPEYTRSVADAMRAETLTLAENIVFGGDSSLKSLFAYDKTFLNETLSQFYKISVGKIKGAGFSQTDLPPERRGILSHGSLLAVTGGEVETSPIVRGLFVRRRLLCGELPPPPPGVAAMAEPDAENKPKRELFNQHQLAACRGCHALINPLGFGIENFDSVGRYRTVERGTPVDPSGTLVNMNGTETKSFTSSAGFFSTLAESSELTSCFVLRAYQFALGRPAGIEDRGVLAALAKKFRLDKYNIAHLMMEIAASDPFTTRASQN